MSQDKFWLVLADNTNEINIENVFITEAEACKKAYDFSKDNSTLDFYVAELKWHYKNVTTVVNNVIKTQLHEKIPTVDETAVKQIEPEKEIKTYSISKTVSDKKPKFEIGDTVVINLTKESKFILDEIDPYHRKTYKITGIVLKDDPDFPSNMYGDIAYRYADADIDGKEYGILSERSFELDIEDYMYD